MHNQPFTPDYVLPTGLDQSGLAASELRVRLGVLIGRYLRDGSAELACSVVAHLDGLCQDPELRDADLFCAYRRLARHWRWLSAQQRQSAGDQA